MSEDVLRTIAASAASGQPLPPALRELGSPLARTVADRLDAGATLPEAFAGALGPELADLLAGPRPGTAEAALLAAEWLRQRRADRVDAIARLTHPLCGLLLVAAAVAVTACYGPAPQAGWLAAGGVLLSGVVLLLCAEAVGLSARLPHLAAVRLHARLASAYERAALVARWRLPEERLIPLLGDDLPRLAATLADAGAEPHCRRLAAYHREAGQRARRRLWWTVMALGYLAGGCLLLAAAIPMVDSWIALFSNFCADL